MRAPDRPPSADDSFAMVDHDAPGGPARAIAEYWHDYAAAVSNDGQFADWAQIAHVAGRILEAIDADAERQQDGAVEAARRFADAWRGAHVFVRETRDGTLLIECPANRSVRLTEPQLRAVLAERTALAARVAELEAEREADTRAVAEACSDLGNDEGPRGIRQMYARFADRIAPLGADTDGGAE